MIEGHEMMLRIYDLEFQGTAEGMGINGPSLLSVLASLDCERAAFAGTHEGYSVWEIVRHLAYAKHYFASQILEGTVAYPYAVGPGGFSAPEDAGPAAWEEQIRYLEEAHRLSKAAIAAIRPEDRRMQLGEWGLSREAAAVSICNHDSYHVAQIRSMGVPGLRRPKSEAAG